MFFCRGSKIPTILSQQGLLVVQITRSYSVCRVFIAQITHPEQPLFSVCWRYTANEQTTLVCNDVYLIWLYVLLFVFHLLCRAVRFPCLLLFPVVVFCFCFFFLSSCYTSKYPGIFFCSFPTANNVVWCAGACIFLFFFAHVLIAAGFAWPILYSKSPPSCRVLLTLNWDLSTRLHRAQPVVVVSVLIPRPTA